VKTTRRVFLAGSAATGLGAMVLKSHAGGGNREGTGVRKFHLCTNCDALDKEPALLETAVTAGIDGIYLAAYFYGYWPYAPERIARWIQKLEQKGLEVNICNVPLGHPGDSLGASSGDFPLTPPPHWRMAVRPDGSQYAGTSLHPPATEENAEALRRLEGLGVKQAFLDDDFRLTPAPGVIGGCFCDKHRRAFLSSHGYAQPQWEELLADIADRRPSPLLRAWVAFTCDELTACFKALRGAAPSIDLGVMVMIHGAEYAGIRLPDYKGAPLRVGEGMFDDASFGPVRNKTGELFSCLFHRRFVEPQRAYSETTAFPAGSLSARNMAAKLAVSTIADVRNTTYMSGLTPFPLSHWEALGPAMRKQRIIHERLAGHVPRGPFKHYWGDASRFVGDTDPYSLFLASGVPFEVVEDPGDEGWTFLNDTDAQALAPRHRGPGILVVRPSARVSESSSVRVLAEDSAALFALKREVLDGLPGTPHIVEDEPVVCAWYPTARAVLLWNLSEARRAFRIRWGAQERPVEVDGSGVALVEDVA
jgi:hypothetical protein